MAPSKVLGDIQNMPPQVTALSKITGRVSTRSQNNSITSVFTKKMHLKDMSKRKADQLSPPKGKTTKRSAFVDLTNASHAAIKKEDKKTGKQQQGVLAVKKQQVVASNITVQKKEVTKILNVAQPKMPVTIVVKSNKVCVANIENIAPKASHQTAKDRKRDMEMKFDSIKKVTSSSNISTKFRRSLNSSQDKSDESSLYTSALEEVSPKCDEKVLATVVSPKKKEIAVIAVKASPKPPPGVVDFDQENMGDPVQVANYAMDIFQYMKEREVKFRVGDYLSKQVLITKWMRCLLVDWMVEVQENFELNHETLYLAVKITDIYLSSVVVTKEVLQLVGAAALLIASKYDERLPPLIDDFIFICENAFTREDVINMEINVFKVIDYNLGIPLSYRFLRRFARCCKASMPILTLARYILELSLMEYHFMFASESKLASAALYLALRMKNVSRWTPCLVYYTGYKLEDFIDLAKQLNAMLRKKPKEQLKTVRNKYSHEVFFEVAKTPLIDDTQL